MLYSTCFANTTDQELCLVPAITGRSKNAQHMGGDVQTSINGLTLPNVVNNNTCAKRRAKRGTGQPSKAGGWLAGGGGVRTFL